MKSNRADNKQVNKKIATKNKLIFMLLALVLGAVAGSVIWFLLFIMGLGIEFVWENLAKKFNSPIYTFAVCLLGGLLIGLWQKKYGDLPQELEEVMVEFKKNGTYPYNNLHILGVAALLPLIFGGALGPEAGLTGIIVGLCCFVGDRFKYAANEMRELAEAGMAATISVVFNSPFFGLTNQLETNEIEEEAEQQAEQQLIAKGEQGKVKHASSREKMLVYFISIVGGMLALMVLSDLFGGGMGLPRFESPGMMGKNEILALVPFALLGTACGIFYLFCHKFTKKLAEPLQDKKVLRALIGGLAIAILGTFLPWTMFSGESQMGELIHVWGELGFVTLLLTAIVKLVLINLCINFGWRGGNIFPIIFSGVALGYALASIAPVEPVFAVAVVVAAMCGAVMGKPVTVLAFLIICFPVTSFFYMGIAAFLGSFLAGFLRVKLA